jgi:hypothetical protein
MNGTIERPVEEQTESRGSVFIATTENPFFDGVFRQYHLDAGGKGDQKNYKNSVFNSKNLALYSYVGNQPLIFIDPDGQIRAECYSTFIKVGGSKTWRNNNPGALEFNGQAGASPSAWDNGRWAKFETEEEGMEAFKENIINVYGDVNLEKMAYKRTPPHENNTEQYIKDLESYGVDPKKKIGEQVDTVMKAIMKAEGYNAYMDTRSIVPNGGTDSVNPEVIGHPDADYHNYSIEVPTN